MIVNSAADWGISDPLKVPKTTDAMRSIGIPEESSHEVVGEPVAFFSQAASSTSRTRRAHHHRSLAEIRGELGAAG